MIEGLLKGKSVVITGAGSGVGRAASQLFAQHGARLIVTDVQESWLEETVAQVKAAGGEVKGVACDVTKRADCDAAVKAAVDAYGRLDVMYNNAGIATPMKPEGGMKSFTDNTEEDIERLYAVNVKGVIFGCQAAIEQFRRCLELSPPEPIRATRWSVSQSRIAPARARPKAMERPTLGWFGG